MNKCTVRTMKMTMLALAAAFASGAASAANYYRMAAEDPSGTSSFSGHKNGSTNPTGWSANPDGTGSLVYSVTSGNAYIFPTNTSRKIRTPPTTTSWAMPADSYLTVQRGATMQVDMKFQSSSTLTLHNLHLEENAGALFVPANGVAEEVDTIAGEISMSDGSSLYLRSMNATRNGFTANITHVLSATVAGRGEVCTYPQESTYDPATITATFGRTERITGDLSGFCGNIVCFGHASVAAAVNLELVNAVSIPANPPSGETAYVVVTNGATLTVDQDWRSFGAWRADRNATARTVSGTSAPERRPQSTSPRVRPSRSTAKCAARSASKRPAPARSSSCTRRRPSPACAWLPTARSCSGAERWD